MKHALGALEFSAEVDEWFNYDGDPHHFRVVAYGENIFKTGRGIDQALIKTLTDIIESVKPLHTRFDIEIGQKIPVSVYISVQCTPQISRFEIIAPSIPQLEAAA